MNNNRSTLITRQFILEKIIETAAIDSERTVLSFLDKILAKQIVFGKDWITL